MTEQPIYLDYAATSPLDRRVLAAMQQCMTLDGDFGNPSSAHAAGAAAMRRVEAAREQIGARVGAAPDRLVFTSGATEANNLAIAGLLAAAPRDRRHVVTTSIEHKSVLDTVRFLERGGCRATFVPCGADGVVRTADVAAAIGPSTALVSVMHVNNETGALQDIPALAAACRERGVTLHVDAAQSVGKVPVALEAWGVHLASLTAHKLCGPKGIGALYVAPGIALEPLLHGGEQQGGLRPGTLPTHQIAGMGEAYRLADPAAEGPRLAALKSRLWEGLSAIPDTRLNGSLESSSPHILNVAFAGVEAESLRLAVGEIAVSAGSACMAATPEASHVLSTMGLSHALASSSLRFGLGRFTDAREIDRAVARVGAEVARLRRLSASAPAWCRT
ncbi:MAG TPA: aminotransferase class V-fold PLP-dependent enzyme [Gammaproteobacteria bacterium]|nr:aminotransferase class V-fold PLP-dependent enzyme [Gammaproteobacteria bacterium]